MARTLSETIAEGRRLIAEATDREAKGFPAPLPWYVSGRHDMIRGSDGDAITGPEPYFERPVANLIVLAVNAFPALLDVAEAAERFRVLGEQWLGMPEGLSETDKTWAEMDAARDDLFAALSALALGPDDDGKEKPR